MVACKQCSTQNSVDSLFCKQCGGPIASDLRTDAQEKLQQLIAEGYRIFNEGRTEEARLVAESALADEPRSTSALSLKGMCHERAVEIAEALEVYERVVELNPDSALDKIKVTHLRQTLAGHILAEPPPRGRRALLGSLAAVVLVVAVGIAIGAASPPNTQVAQNQGALDPPSGTTSTFTDLKADAPAGTGKTPAAPGPEAPAANDGRGAATEPNRGAVNRPAPFRLQPFNGTQLPLPNGGIGGERPLSPPAPGEITLRPRDGSSGAARPSESGPDPVIEGPSSSSGGADTKRPDSDPGLIEIKVSRPKATPGGAQELPDGNGTEALLKTARQQFLLGRYSQAATSYEAALRGGADPASTNQRIAQCYANVGNSSQAIAAYKKAITAYEASMNGPGDKSRAQSALEACRRALKTLGG